MTNQRIAFLDYMRILAFTLVVMGHKFNIDLLTWANDPNTHTTLQYTYKLLSDASLGGAMGVVIFFLVSGYIIPYVLQRESTFEFYLKRVFRIYPLYISAIVIEMVLDYFNGTDLPPLGVFLPRILLLGDFFNTPLALAGVEWTLRIEILFYVFMGIIKKIGFIQRGNVVTALFLIISYVIAHVPAYPKTEDFHNGYFSLYFMFLFIGAVIFFVDRKLVNRTFALISIIIMLYWHLTLMMEVAPSWGRSNYALIGTAIFLGSCLLKDKFHENKECHLVSELTYSIYLFHNWLLPYLGLLVAKIDIHHINSKVQMFVLLFIICFFLNRCIERPFISIGKKLAMKYFPRKP